MKELLWGLKGRRPCPTVLLKKEGGERRDPGPRPSVHSAIFGSGSATAPPTPASASSPGPIRKQPSGSGNSREDPEAVSAVTRECGNPPFARRQWRQQRRRPRARMAGGGCRGPVREGLSVHARGGEAGGGAEFGVAGSGGEWGEPGERGGTTPPGKKVEGAWPSDARWRASGRLEVGPSVGGWGGAKWEGGGATGREGTCQRKEGIG